jgi:predicted transposase YdaD
VSLPYDATLKYLVEGYALDWVRQFGFPSAEQVEAIDADVSTVTAAADRVLRVTRPIPCLIHFELQSGRDPTLLPRMLKYNVLLYERHAMPVLSVAVLLRRSADLPELTGQLSLSLPDGLEYLRFGFRVVRLWQESPESLIHGGVGTLPLVLLSDLPTEALPETVRELESRFRAEATEAQWRSLWASTYVLMGLRYPVDLIDQLLQGVADMKESVTYQKIVAEGRAEGFAMGRADEARRLLLRLAGKKFGPPDPEVRAAIESISDPEHLERLIERLFDLSSWQELLREP